MKRTISIILVLTLSVVLFVGCGKTGGKDEKTASVDPDYVYVSEYIQLPEEVTEVRSPVLIGDTVYFAVPLQAGMTNQFGIQAVKEQLCKIGVDGTGFEIIEGFAHPELPETAFEGSMWSISKILPADETHIWIFETGDFGYFDSDSFQFVNDSRSNLRKIELSTGTSVLEISIEGQSGGMLMFSFGGRAPTPLTMDRDGNIYVSGLDNKIMMYSPGGEEIGSVSVPSGNIISDLITAPDGKACVIYSDISGKVMLAPINKAMKSLETVYDMPMIRGRPVMLPGKSAGITFYDDNSLYALEPGSDRRIELINWIDCDIDGTSLTVIGAQDENMVLCSLATYPSSGLSDMLSLAGAGGISIPGMELLMSGPEKTEFVILRKTPTSEVKQKTTLTLAVNGLDSFMRTAVLDFNKRDPEYRVRVVDYSVHNTMDDFMAGITKLNTEIISGNSPDIIQTRNLPFRTYVSKGLLEDLYPYLDNDTELGGRDAVLSAFRTALESDGKLCRIGSGFWITSLVGNADVVGPEIGWNMDELNAVLSELPEDTGILPYYATRDMVLDLVFTYNLDEYVNYKTGESTVNTPEFIKLLELVKSFPETFDWSGWMGQILDENSEIMSGRQLLQMGTFNGFGQLLSTDALFGGKAAFKGFPCQTKNGFAFEPMLCIAMSSQSEHKDGSWRFIRTILTEEFQKRNTMVFPSNQKCFDLAVQSAMTENTEPSYSIMGMDLSSLLGDADLGGSKDTDGDGVADVYPKGFLNGPNGELMFYYAMTQEQYERFMDFINQISRVTERDETLVGIVRDEVGAFFNSQKSAGETAELIQIRVQLYLNEQK
ncbi:MAG: extracellular solute-binding protein [Clostridiales bacterium]|jgi:ABC-type glycerol-3-phosphate transport system substrate-binding protein|nr:extracellular solute-binding protein [Clostridiales bacterium]